MKWCARESDGSGRAALKRRRREGAGLERTARRERAEGVRSGSPKIYALKVELKVELKVGLKSTQLMGGRWR